MQLSHSLSIHRLTISLLDAFHLLKLSENSAVRGEPLQVADVYIFNEQSHTSNVGGGGARHDCLNCLNWCVCVVVLAAYWGPFSGCSYTRHTRSFSSVSSDSQLTLIKHGWPVLRSIVSLTPVYLCSRSFFPLSHPWTPPKTAPDTQFGPDLGEHDGGQRQAAPLLEHSINAVRRERCRAR